MNYIDNKFLQKLKNKAKYLLFFPVNNLKIKLPSV